MHPYNFVSPFYLADDIKLSVTFTMSKIAGGTCAAGTVYPSKNQISLSFFDALVLLNILISCVFALPSLSLLYVPTGFLCFCTTVLVTTLCDTGLCVFYIALRDLFIL